MNIYLTGFMGTGKTSAGRALARLLRRPFVDTDCWIERRSHMSVPRIFGGYGETIFREWERRAVAQAAARRSCVVALGGGALLDSSNRRLVSKGLLVALTCPEAELWRRLRPRLAARPLLAGGRAAFRRLLRRRRPSYAGAHLTVSTAGRTPAEAAALIARRLAA